MGPGVRQRWEMDLKIKAWLGALTAVALIGAACGGEEDGGGSADAGAGSQEGGSELIVFAASSLTESFEELGGTFEEDHPGIDVRFSFESSSTLVPQIVEGAPADVFASADVIQMGVVEDEGLAEDPVPFATNRLVIAVPTGNPAGIEVPADLADDGIKLVLAAPEVPVGNYAREMFKRLKIAPEVESNVVSNEEDVKAVVSKVRLGEADAGVVYRTDITSAVEGDLELIEVPPGASPIAVYPITVVGETDNPKEAQDWVDLVLSDEGQQVLEDFAFGSPAQ